MQPGDVHGSDAERFAPSHIDVVTHSLLAQYGRPFSQGDVLFVEGAPSVETFVIHAGRVRLLKRVYGTSQSLEVLGAGDVFGEGAILEGSMRTSTAVALSEGIAVVLDRIAVHQRMEQLPALAGRILARFARRLHDAEEQIEVLALGDPQLKVIRALLALARTQSPELAISPLELAGRAGVDVTTVKRAVQRLREQHYVHIVEEWLSIPDVEGLQRLSNLLGAHQVPSF